MTVYHTPTAPAESEYLSRVLRCVAVICVGYGTLGALDAALSIANVGLFYSTRFGPPYDRAARAMEILFDGLNVFLVVGGVALWRWKRWSRIILIVWASLWIVLAFISNFLWTIYFLEQPRAATQPYLPSASYYVWTMFLRLPTRCAFPALVLSILVQPQVAKMWALVSGGFEVLPFAAVAPNGSQST